MAKLKELLAKRSLESQERIAARAVEVRQEIIRSKLWKEQSGWQYTFNKSSW